MENQNEREAWNERWLRQLIVWKAELDELRDEVKRMEMLVELALTQIEIIPPE